jgi:GNAT superfamily N-acetyltransferase
VTDPIIVRKECTGDEPAIRTVLVSAFRRQVEAEIVDGLRVSSPDTLSLVALLGDRLVGHVLFTPVTIEAAQRSIAGAGLAPLAVLPDFQKRGIGARLVRARSPQVGRHALRRRARIYRVLFSVRFPAGVTFPDCLSVRGRPGRSVHDPDPERANTARRDWNGPLPAGVLGDPLTHPRRIHPWLPESTWKPGRSPANALIWLYSEEGAASGSGGFPDSRLTLAMFRAIAT